jgi:hypothetical protein
MFESVDELFDKHLLDLAVEYPGQRPWVSNKSTLNRLAASGYDSGPLAGLVEAIVEQLATNWRQNGERSLGKEAWRHTRNASISDENSSKEVRLQRRFAEECDRRSDSAWANEVPVTAAMSSDQRKPRSVDLAYRDGKAVELLELKFDSNTPLSAACQAVGYAAALLFCRRSWTAIGGGEDLDLRPAITAERVTVSVLAPKAFYLLEPVWGPWLANLEQRFDSALRQAAAGIDKPFDMGFRFTQLGADFESYLTADNEEAAQRLAYEAITGRQRVFAA